MDNMPQDPCVRLKGELSRAALAYAEDWQLYCRGDLARGLLDASWKRLEGAARAFSATMLAADRDEARVAAHEMHDALPEGYRFDGMGQPFTARYPWLGE